MTDMINNMTGDCMNLSKCSLFTSDILPCDTTFDELDSMKHEITMLSSELSKTWNELTQRMTRYQSHLVRRQDELEAKIISSVQEKHRVEIDQLKQSSERKLMEKKIEIRTLKDNVTLKDQLIQKLYDQMAKEGSEHQTETETSKELLNCDSLASELGCSQYDKMASLFSPRTDIVKSPDENMYSSAEINSGSPLPSGKYLCTSLYCSAATTERDLFSADLLDDERTAGVFLSDSCSQEENFIELSEKNVVLQSDPNKSSDLMETRNSPQIVLNKTDKQYQSDQDNLKQELSTKSPFHLTDFAAVGPNAVFVKLESEETPTDIEFSEICPVSASSIDGDKVSVVPRKPKLQRNSVQRSTVLAKRREAPSLSKSSGLESVYAVVHCTRCDSPTKNQRKPACTVTPALESTQIITTTSLSPHDYRTYTDSQYTHVCDYCDRTFRWSSNLVDHVRIHLGIRPYKCGLCGHASTTKGNVLQHLFKIHKLPREQSRRFVCPNTT